jgi:transposase
MDDTRSRQFFERPEQTYHRQYEALRAVFVDGRRQKEVAKEFGYQYSTLRQLVYEFRKHCNRDDASQESPFFAS